MRTFTVVICPANDLMAPINRMPVIIPQDAYDGGWPTSSPTRATCWVAFPSEPMTMWPISTRVN